VRETLRLPGEGIKKETRMSMSTRVHLIKEANKYLLEIHLNHTKKEKGRKGDGYRKEGSVLTHSWIENEETTAEKGPGPAKTQEKKK